jgi:hypothetical protein
VGFAGIEERIGKICTISLALMRTRWSLAVAAGVQDVMKVVLSALLATLAAACSGPGGLFRQYEYEEELYLSLDGSGTLYVNSSIPALNALRGTAFDASAPIDRAAMTRYFTSPGTRVTRVTTSSRSGRRFVHLRIDVANVRRLSDAAPFAWSAYDFGQRDDLFVYRQTVGAAAARPSQPPASGQWNGNEIVAFRLHLPSKVAWHNTPDHVVHRGNILVWEQPLKDRLHGDPLSLEARMETQSILYRTLLLFGGTFLAVAVMFVTVIWLVVRRTPKTVEV